MKTAATCSFTPQTAILFSQKIITFATTSAPCLTKLFESKTAIISVETGEKMSLVLTENHEEYRISPDLEFFNRAGPIAMDKIELNVNIDKVRNLLIMLHDLEITVTSGTVTEDLS